MSLVIAIKDKDRVVLGSDKQASVGDYKNHNNTKIWPVQDLQGAIMGSVGTARASQIIQYSSVVDKNCLENINNIDTDFIVNSLAPTIATALKANGFNTDASPDSPCTMIPNSFLFAYKDKAWVIWNDLSVTELEDYLAIGSGSDVARGVLYATMDKNPFERIFTSIDAATDSTLFVDDGIDLLATKEYHNDFKILSKMLGIEEKPKPKKKAEKKKLVKEKPIKEEEKKN